jgi:hypothetical protein
VSIELPSEVLTAQVVRNLRDGDFVWVTVAPTLDEDEVAAVHAIMSALLPENANLLVTRGNYLERIKVESLEDLLRIQQIIELAIRDFTIARAHEA